MSITLTTKFAPYTDEIFKEESKKYLLTNTDYDFTGAHAIKVYKITTAAMNDYARNVYDAAEAPVSRFGALLDLNATTEELLLTQDRSFIFNIDLLDYEETAQQLAAGTALARQLREVVVPEVDTYTYGVMVDNAGTTADPISINESTYQSLYDYVIRGSEVLDENEVPEDNRVLVVTPEMYRVIKKLTQFDNTDVGAQMRQRGVVGMLDGMLVIKVPASRLPVNFGFMIAHPCATVAPVKLDDYKIHAEQPLSSGAIVTGRICYDAFVLDNKKMAIYVQPISISAIADKNSDGEYTQAELEALSLAQLKVFAKEHDITLTATTKAAIITEILTALAD